MSKWTATLLLLALLTACTSESDNTVTLVADNETRSVSTHALTVRDLLDEAKITLGERDRVTPVEPTFIEDRMTIRVIRVQVFTETAQREIPFERRTVHDASIPTGETRLLEPGITGIEELTYRVTLEDGVEIERQPVLRNTIQQPRTEVLLIGSQPERAAVPITGTVAYIANHNVWLVHTTSTNRRRLTHDGDLDGRVFALMPDGSHLLYTRITTETGGSEPLNSLWMVETATSGSEPTGLDGENVLWADWKPGCTKKSIGVSCYLAYSTGEPTDTSPSWRAENDLWVGRPSVRDGRWLSHRRIVDPSVGGAYGWWGTLYAWSPDGTHLAYANANEVGVVSASGGRQTTLARFPPYRTYGPWVWTPTVDWSQEGEFIVTTLHGPAPSGESPEDSPVFDVWALAADSTITVELASEAGMWAAPTYSPDGDAILFGRARSPRASQTSGYSLHLVDRDGSDLRQLYPPPQEIGLDYPAISWGPGGDQIIFIYQGNLYLIDTADGEVNQLTDEGTATAVQWRW